MLGDRWVFILGPPKSARSILTFGILRQFPGVVSLYHSEVVLTAHHLAKALCSATGQGVVSVERDLGENPIATTHAVDTHSTVGLDFGCVDVTDVARSICSDVYESYGSPVLFVEQTHFITPDVWGAIDGVFPNSLVIKFYREEDVVVSERLKALQTPAVHSDVAERVREQTRVVNRVMDNIDRGLSIDVADMKRHPHLWINVVLDYLGLNPDVFTAWDEAVAYIEKYKHIDCPGE